MVKKSLVNLKHTRSAGQKDNMIQAVKDGVCLFCPAHIKKYHVSPIEKKGKYWMITKSDYPYTGTKLHYLFIYNKHIDTLKKIRPEAMIELIRHLKWLEKKFKVKGGSILVRFGDSSRTSASITHLHGHLIIGGKQSPGKEPITTAVGFKI